MKDINIDRIFALVYLAVGYGFIYTFSSMNFEKHIAIFTVFYAATVLFYLFYKKYKACKRKLVLVCGADCNRNFLCFLECNGCAADYGFDCSCRLLDIICIRQTFG